MAVKLRLTGLDRDSWTAAEWLATRPNSLERFFECSTCGESRRTSRQLRPNFAVLGPESASRERVWLLAAR